MQIVHGYRDDNGKAKTKIIKNIGYLDKVKEQYADPEAHFKEVARQMEIERRESSQIILKIDKNAKISRNENNRKNFGYVVFSRIYHELELDRFCKNLQRHAKYEYNLNSILKLLVYSRLLFPCSKKKATEIKGYFFDKFDFDLDDVYDALTHFDRHSGSFQKHIHEHICKKYGRDTSLVYYDVTNYYFETDTQDGFRMRGYSKEHRRDPIVQMGLAMDKKNIPITYKLFEGNTHDSQTMIPALAEVKREYGVERIIVVADKGLNSGDNIAFNTILDNGYIFSQSVRGASEEFKKYVLDNNGYVQIGDDYKKKSRILPVKINVTVSGSGKNKRTKKIEVDQKQVVFYSKKYADRAKRQREEILSKAADMISNPSKYNKATSYGAASYIANIEFDKSTGEVLKTEKKLFIDMEKVKEEERLDGFYSIVTSELDETDERIIEMYRGLWRIEETFKITKSVLAARPVYLSRKDHINAHFLICFIALTLLRIIEQRLSNKYPAHAILDSIRNAECSHLDSNFWLFDYANEITDSLNIEFNLNFGKKLLELSEIKNIFSQSKIT